MQLRMVEVHYHEEGSNLPARFREHAAHRLQGGAPIDEVVHHDDGFFRLLSFDAAAESVRLALPAHDKSIDGCAPSPAFTHQRCDRRHRRELQATDLEGQARLESVPERCCAHFQGFPSSKAGRRSTIHRYSSPSGETIRCREFVTTDLERTISRSRSSLTGAALSAAPASELRQQFHCPPLCPVVIQPRFHPRVIEQAQQQAVVLRRSGARRVVALIQHGQRGLFHIVDETEHLEHLFVDAGRFPDRIETGVQQEQPRTM